MNVTRAAAMPHGASTFLRRAGRIALASPLIFVVLCLAPGTAQGSAPGGLVGVSPTGATAPVSSPIDASGTQGTSSLNAPGLQKVSGTAPAHWLHGFDPHATFDPHTAGDSNLNLSSNWSGQIDTGTTYSEVVGSWVVPSVTPSQSPVYSSSWIGIDGATNSSLIQTGTDQDTTGGTTTYRAWFEILPASETLINEPVSPGDQMEALIEETSPGTWEIVIEDVTQNWTGSGSFAYSGPADSAEWIEEAPTVGGVQSTLADFGTANFGNLGVAGSDPNETSLAPVYMLNNSLDTIAYPGAYDGTNSSFSDFYGSPPAPTVTSISPPQGPTSGGTTVTISGTNLLYGPLAVSFGSTQTNFSASENGQITATAPAGVAGTTNITVTTLGGTSAIATTDTFTYQAPAPAPAPAPASAPTTPHGYWLVGSDGGIFTFGSAQFYGSTGSLHLQRPVVGIVPTTDRGGYWLDASDGGIFAFGDAGFYGSIPGLGLNPAGSGRPNSLDAPIVGMVPSADGGGYFMVASDGGVFAFGDAHFAGSCPGIGGCSGAAVAVMPDASGNGYWLVTQTGRVYTFGDAPYFGAPGNVGSAITSAVRTPNGEGYWLLTANGTVYPYGNAGNYGEATNAFGGANPATALFTTSDGGGYWMASAGGTVLHFGDAPSDGDMTGTHLNGSIIAATGF